MTQAQFPGTVDKRPSISDVARAAGVSRAAVSKVIRNAYGVSPAMRQRVETAIEELGYRPRVGARALRGSGFTIGFEAPHMGNSFFNQILTGAAPGLAASRYQVIVAPSSAYLSGSAVLEALVDRQVDGIIAIASRVDATWLEALGAQIPLVVLARHEPSRTYDTVTGDDASGADLVMDHLLGLGHRRIAHLTMSKPLSRSTHAIRRDTYLRRMEQAAGEPVVLYTETEQGSYRHVRALLERADPPTAIFAAHDTLALETLRAVTDAGRSDTVSVVGYDDIELASHPLISLTTVDQYGPEVGAAAAGLLMQRIAGDRSTAQHVRFAPQLRPRRSSRALGASCETLQMSATVSAPAHHQPSRPASPDVEVDPAAT